MGFKDRFLPKPPEDPTLPPVRSNGYAPKYNVPANPGARNLPLPGSGDPTPSTPNGAYDSHNPPKPVWSKIGNGYERLRQRKAQSQQDSGKIPPVPIHPEPGYANGGYGQPDGYSQPSGYGQGAGFYGKQENYGQPPGGFGSQQSGSHYPPSYRTNESGYGGAQPRAGKTAQEELEDEYGATAAQSRNDDGKEQAQEERTESDEEVEAVKQQMRFTKQETLSSSRNALRIAREAEETATNSMMRLGDQSEKLADTERNLDMSKAHALRADDNAREIERLNRSILRPHFTVNKTQKRAAQEARIINRHVDEREERERLRAEAFQAQRRVEDSLGGPGSSSRFQSRFAFGRNKDAAADDPAATKAAQRARYQFEATASDDELEDELDDNLDQLGQIAGNLNRLGKAMGTEIDVQNRRIGRLSDKTSTLDTKVYASTMRLDGLHK